MDSSDPLPDPEICADARLLIDGPELWEVFERDILGATERVYVQTLSFEGDDVGRGLAAAMEASAARDRRIVVDSFTNFFINDRFVFSPANLADALLRDEVRETGRMIRQLRRNGVHVQFVNPMGALLRRITARNHKKILVVDDRCAYVGGNNFSEHNFAWHDLMLRVEHSELIEALAADVRATCEGRNQTLAERFGGYELLLCDGATNRAQFARIEALIGGARDEIFVESPYITFPVLDWLIAAAARGVRVTLVTAEANNWGLMQQYVEHTACRGKLELRAYSGRFTHLKAMLIDSSHLVLGSSNFDAFSFRGHQELMMVISAADVIAQFRERVLEPDLAASVPIDASGSSVAGALSALGLRALDAMTRALALIP